MFLCTEHSHFPVLAILFTFLLTNQPFSRIMPAASFRAVLQHRSSLRLPCLGNGTFILCAACLTCLVIDRSNLLSQIVRRSVRDCRMGYWPTRYTERNR